MRPIKLRVENFAGYKEETFNFDDAPDLFAVIGHNGAGKSTFFVDAITICLFNQGRTSDSKGTGLEQLIKTGCDQFTVDFTFAINEQEIRVVRTRHEKSQELELFIDNVDHTEKLRETQEKIHDIIKMDYETFLDTTCIGQGESGRFMKKKPDKRKEVFTKVLGLSNYDVLEEDTKELRKETKKEIERLEEKLEELQESVNNRDNFQHDIDEAESQIFVLEAQIQTKEQELEKELAEKAQHDQIVKSVNDVLNKRRQLKGQIDSAESSISQGEGVKAKLELTLAKKENTLSTLSELNDVIESLTTEQNTLNNNKSSLNTMIDVLTVQGKELKAKHTRLKDFNEADCEFCGQRVTEDHKNKHLDQLFNEAKGIIGQINVHKKEVEEIDKQLSLIRNKLSTAKLDLRDLNETKTSIDQAEAKLPTVESRLEEVKSNLENIRQEYEENLAIEVENVGSRVFKDSEIKNELNNLRNQLTRYSTNIGIAKNELKKIEKDLVRITEIESEIKDKKKKFAIYDDLVKAWGKKGIQAVIIDNALDDIQDEINKFLEILSNGKVNVEFKTQKEKGDNAIETLDIIINDEEGSRTYETYSGGEKFRVDFACHVGLAKFLAKRAGSPVDFFVIDEGVGSQDETAKEQFIIAVNKLTTIFSKVMVITHIPDIIESFNNRVEVYKDPIEGSKIKIVS